MTTLLSISIFCFVYAVSYIFSVRWIKLAYYHEHGRWFGLIPDKQDKFFCLAPFVNILFAIFAWSIFDWRHEDYIEDNFFKPKK